MNKMIDISINNKRRTIMMDKNRKKYTDKELDITIIEIRPNKDEIKKYLEIGEEDIEETRDNIKLEYRNKSIYILHYPKEELSVSCGVIKRIKNRKIIEHKCSTADGSSGGPIISLKTFKVVGIHFGGTKILNHGIFIQYIIDQFINRDNSIYKDEIKIRNQNEIKERNQNEKKERNQNEIKIRNQNEIKTRNHNETNTRNKNEINIKNKNEINANDKNEINIKYITEEKGKESIFGYKFVENNKNNIELKINGTKSKLIKEFELNNGENNITIVIKNKITNLEDMFYKFNKLYNINELKYLNTTDITNFKGMFCGCSSITDIKPLQNWNVSNGNNFKYMFKGCTSLSDIRPLQNWNVSNGKEFYYMFYECSSLSDIKPLQNWNVSKGNNFVSMFGRCHLYQI